MASVANTFTSAPNNTTNAFFQAWGGAVANAISACGWVLNTDAAQIDFTSVATPLNTAFISKGYQVWKMADTGAGANQASNPVMMKIEYGSGNTTYSNAISLWLQFGTGVNASGGLLGVLSARFRIEAAGVANNIISAYSGDVNRFGIALWGFSVNATQNTIGGANNALFFSVERTKDASGNDTNEGILILGRCANYTLTATYQQYMNLTTGPTGTEGNWGSLMPTSAVPVSTGVQTAVYPIYFSKGVFVNPGMNVLCVNNAQVTELSTMVVPIYGQNHTYMCCSNVMYSSTSTRLGGPSTLMFRWE